MKESLKIALVGNPNTGKSSIFNALTGLHQKVVNYPGATVEKKKGFFHINETTKASLLDLPGTYSLTASSLDEYVATRVIIDKTNEEYPDIAVVVADVENLKRNLLLFSQVKDLGIPTILVINMADLMEKNAITIDIPALEKKLHTKIALVSTRKKEGLEHLKKLLLNYKELSTAPCLDISKLNKSYFESLGGSSPKEESVYRLWLLNSQPCFIAENEIKSEENIRKLSALKHLQQKETVMRYAFINNVLSDSYYKDITRSKDLRRVLDRILMHRIYGYVIFIALLFLIFQAIYNWSSYPMELIDLWFSQLSSWLQQALPEGMFSRLLANGIVPGIGGIVTFVPQIAFLFLFISVLEETGYMSRIVFLTDKIMRPFGLSGKSVISLISGTACAIPAIMSTRNMESTKERLIAILVTPFITCSARLPVYLILITLVIPDKTLFGIGIQGLVLMGLYVLGFGVALLSAYILNRVLKIEHNSIFVIEMPDYKIPLLKNVLFTIVIKTKGFLLGAGKIILAVSVVIWFLASHGPKAFSEAEKQVRIHYSENQSLPNDELEAKIASRKLANSYIGKLGLFFEPVFSPLGYNWKINIAILSSFLAREVFVGTLSVIYSADDDDENTIRSRISEDVNPLTGKAVFNMPSGVSLLLFYAFSMQCVSTLAITKKETNSFKWPLLQFLIMSILAYISAFFAYQILS